MDAKAPDLAPALADMHDLPGFDIPLVEATAASLEGYGELIDGPDARPVEIVRWPASGWRPVDPGTGDEAGTTEGNFEFWWAGDVLRARNEAVSDHYVTGWAREPSKASEETATVSRTHLQMWHANYHPDGGQLFFPLEPGPFVIPLALPGDDIEPAHFKAFRFSGPEGLYIHPNVWHETIIPLADRMRFFDRQGKVHARVSVDFGKEFGVYLSVPLVPN